MAKKKKSREKEEKVKKKKKVAEEKKSPKIRFRPLKPWEPDKKYSGYLDFLDGTLNASERKLGMVSSIGSDWRLSTGTLALDVINSRIGSGWYTNLGKEASGKSTAAMTMLSALLHYQGPIKPRPIYFDPENAIDPVYTSQIIGVNNIEEVIGLRDPRNGKLIKRGLINYYDSNVLEHTFKMMRRVLRALPDKRYDPESQTWYMVYDRDNASKAAMAAAGLKHDKKLYSMYQNYWCPVDDGALQVVFFLDSYPSLSPEKIASEDDEDDGQGLGAKARAYAEWAPLVRGFLRRKHCSLVGVNQIRTKPMARGNPDYEPCGEALKFVSDCRTQFDKRAVPNGWDKAMQANGYPDTYLGEEESGVAEGGRDQYSYIHIKNIKNKKGPIKRQGMMRIWTSDHNGEAQGIDPVFDTFDYLERTNQIEQIGKGAKTQFQLKFKEFEGIQIDWTMFKTMILAEASGSKRLTKYFLDETGLGDMVKVRRRCFKQIETGKSEELLMKASYKKGKDTSDDAEDDMEE